MNTIVPFDFQLKVADEIVAKLNAHNTVLLNEPVGYGKTYEICQAIKKLESQGFFKYDRLWQVVWVTKATVLKQTEKVIKQFKLNNLISLVTNYEQLRSSFGKLFISFERKVVHGQERLHIKWSPYIFPRLFVFDECQALRNDETVQTKIIESLLATIKHPNFPSLGRPVSFIFSSATPFVRVSEAKIFTCSTDLKFKGMDMAPHSGAWELLASSVCKYSLPTDFNAAAVERLTEVLKPYIVRSDFHDVQKSMTKAGKKLHKAVFSTLLVNANEGVMKKYNAYKQELEAWFRRNTDATSFQIRNRLQKYIQSLELLRAPLIADLMIEAHKNGFAPTCAVNYKDTVIQITLSLLQSGIDLDEVALIWGGVTKNRDDLKIDEMNKVILEELGVFNPSIKKRTKSIEDFQEGRANFCIYTFKAGGVGISLHHWKESLRPRVLYLSPTYSAIDLAQACGRVPRLTSLSDTPINMVFIKDTEESVVAEKVAAKMKCLKKAVESRETWYDLLAPERVKHMVSVEQTTEDLVESLEGVCLEEELYECR